MKSSKIRTLIPLIILGLAFVAFIANVALGTFSGFGWGDFVLMCPLGALGSMLAAKTVIPRALISLLIALAFILVCGRAFCAWLCPVPVVSKLRNAFASGKKPEAEKPAEGAAAPLTAEEKALLAGGCSACAAFAGSQLTGTQRGKGLDVRHVVLIVALVTTLIFGFPVFCLICPIGLSFATLFLTVNLFVQGDVSWMTVVVPLVLLAETVFFKKWCHTFCPMGALQSLVAKGNKTFKPVVATEKCLEESRGVKCGACVRACPEHIDLHHPELSEAAINECTRCRACVDACPADAISLPLLVKKPTE